MFKVLILVIRVILYLPLILTVTLNLENTIDPIHFFFIFILLLFDHPSYPVLSIIK